MFGIDKFYHFLFYGLSSFLLGSMASQLSPRLRSLERIFWIALALWIIGILDEFRQFLEPERDTEFLDAVANVAGISVGMLVPVLYALRLGAAKKKLSKAYIPIVIFTAAMTYSLTFLTSKGPPTEFFPDQTEKASQEVFLTTQTNRGFTGLREKYLPQLLYIENEYRDELISLIQYTKQNGHLFEHFWRMKQLGEATEEQFQSILKDMQREVEHKRLPEDILRKVEKEFNIRKNRQRAQILKDAFVQKRG